MPKEEWDGFDRRSREKGLGVKAVAEEAELPELFLVRQKGRLFQHDHPTVPVLLDRGRYLVVKITDEATRRAVQRSEPCYKVLPLPANTVVFEERALPEARVAADPLVKQFVDAVDRERFVNTLTRLTNFHTRHSLTSDYQSAAQWCLSELQGMHYSASLQEISVGEKPSHNVVADKAGSAAEDQRQLVLLTAHLDSINWHEHGSPDAVAPGADDNGTGSAGLLECARVFQNHAFSHDLRFVLFGGEEQGLHGSEDYVSSLTGSDRNRIRAVVNMDMIGGLNTQDPGVTLESSINFSEMINQLVAAGQTYTPLKIETSWHYFDSDHVPFINAGIPAVLTIEGADTSNHFIHSPDDTPAHVSETLAVEILRMNVAFIVMTAR
jgi:Zn-dependent M28 family amino/carboxypeptidase